MRQTPAKLRDLAVNAFIHFTQSLIIKLQTLCVQTSMSSTIEGFETAVLHPVCCFISDLVAATVPSTLANDFSEKLCLHLMIVKSLYNEESNSSLAIDVKEMCTEIMNVVISAVIHPSTTSFEFPYYKLLDTEVNCHHIMKNINITKIIDKLKNVKILKLHGILQRNITSIDSWNFNNLQEFVFMRDCSNSIVEIISKHSPNLIKLDVRISNAVTDEAVKYLFNFQKLEYLDVVMTGITSKGLMLIMTGLQKNDSNAERLSLKVFNADLDESQFSMLPRHFPELTSCCVQYYIKGNLKFLHKLKHLKRLSFASRGRNGIRFSKIKRVLSVIGDQILHLDFEKQSNLNLCLVAEKCPNLQSLSLIYFAQDLHRLVVNPLPNFNVGNLPEITSVTVCQINITFEVSSICYFLSRLVNLKILKITWIDEYSKYIYVLKYVFERMKNSQLSVVEIYSFQVKVVDGDVMILRGDRYLIIENASEFETIVKNIILKRDVFHYM
ncbi:hypothetical protein C0J52_00933 [Blattella germanica]|nr:hypothetical protein C0J52_00933 [Blattella germanica]PSN53645.1 hypothetical protein C0J52_00933 [Blattella germanica]